MLYMCKYRSILWWCLAMKMAEQTQNQPNGIFIVVFVVRVSVY